MNGERRGVSAAWPFPFTSGSRLDARQELEMPDFQQLMIASLAAAVMAAALLLIFLWPWRAPHSTRQSLGWTIGTAAGFYVGCGLLEVWPHWPPLEVRDRWLVILLPATIIVESVVTLATVPRWLAWTLRFSVAAAATPILLYNSVYLAEKSGPGSREWSITQAIWILVAFAAALGLIWFLLDRLQARSTKPVVPAALAMTCMSGAVAVMMSGYFTGGQLGLPFAGALGGTALASWLFLPATHSGGSPGIGLVALFSLLALGRFFGELSTTPALFLMFAPLLAWMWEAPLVRRFGPNLRAVTALVVVMIPLAAGMTTLSRENEAKRDNTSQPGEPTTQDYLDFGR